MQNNVKCNVYYYKTKKKKNQIVCVCYLYIKQCYTVQKKKKKKKKKKDVELTVLTGISRAPEDYLQEYITKTCLYKIDPLQPHFYIVKLGLTGVFIIFLSLLMNIDCGYSLEPPRRGGSNEYPQYMFWAEIWKNIRIFIWKFSFFLGKIFSIFE